MSETHRGRKNRFDHLVIADGPPIPGPAKRAKAAAKPSAFDPDPAPAHFGPEMRDWWAAVMRDYEIDLHRRHLLQLACEAFDRAQGARERVLAEGMTIVDKHNVLRMHPCVAVERDARLSFSRLVKQLDLDPPQPDGRIGPRFGGGYGVTSVGGRPWE